MMLTVCTVGLDWENLNGVNNGLTCHPQILGELVKYSNEASYL
jgi:hypothetical protein